MPDLGEYAVYVLLAYGVSLSLIAILVIASVARGRKVREVLDELDARASKKRA